MTRRRLAVAGSLLLLAGCVTFPNLYEEPRTAQVAGHPFETGARAPLTKVSFRPGSTESAWRVDEVGRKLTGANPQAGVRPAFAVIGVSEPEVFHTDTHIVYITEGLVRQCRDDTMLSAVLANELGRMISEREAKVAAEVRRPNRLPPVQLPIGSNGYSPAADPTHYIEMAKFEKAYPKTPRPLTPPEPQKIARTLLERAGYKATDLDAAAPLLKAAERHCALEDQIRGKQSNWRP